MSTIQIDQLLESAIAEVLESMCFLSIDSNSPTLCEAGDPWVSRSLTFRGPQTGSFGIRVPLATARIIASNLLGQDQGDVSDEQSSEAMGEVANMICGSLLSRLDSERAFDLTTPKCDENFVELWTIENRIAKTFVLDEGMISAWIALKQV